MSLCRCTAFVAVAVAFILPVSTLASPQWEDADRRYVKAPPAIDISTPVPMIQQERELIAVIILEAINVSEDDARAITDQLRYHLGETGQFNLLERQKMDSIMEELGFQLTGATNRDDERIVEVGQILGTRKIVAGSVSKVGSIFTLNVRIIDVETSTIVDQASSRAENLEEILEVATRYVAHLLAGDGQLNLMSDFIGAEVLIDGELIEETTPVEGINLTPGLHNIEIRAPGYTRWEQTVQLDSREEITLHTDIAPKSRLVASGLSLLVPSLGQFYSGRRTSGLGVAVVCGGVATFAGLQLIDFVRYRSFQKDVENLEYQLENLRATIDEQGVDILSSKTRLDDVYEKLQSRYESLRTISGILAGLWILNALDAFAFMPRLDQSHSYSPALEPQFLLRARNGCLQIGFRISF